MRTFKLKNSLSIKILKVVFLAYLLITIITLSVHLFFQYGSTQNELNDEVISIEKNFKDSLSTAVWNFSVEEINSILKGINNSQYISGVELLDKNDIVINQEGEVNVKEYLKHTFKLKRNYKGKALEIGTIQIYSDPNITLEKYKQSVDFIVKNTLVVYFVVSLVLLLIFYRYLTKPLNRLTEALQGVNLENLDECELLKENIDTDKQNKDELELFKVSFIEMINKILSSSKELSSLNATLEKKVEDRTINLENEKNKFRTFLDAAMEAIFISKDGICIDVNQSAVDIFGYGSKEDMIGNSLFTFVAPESYDLVKEKLKQKDSLPYEGSVLRKDNSKFAAYIRGIYIDENKNIRVSSVVDISHLKQLESQSKLASMGEMIGNISHQWRQPLSIISTAATGIKIKKEMGMLEDEEFYEACDHINDNAQYLSQTIDDFKNFIKGDKEPVKFNLKNDTNSFIQLVNTTIKNHKIQVVLDLEEDIELHGFPNELIQCFINIFNNSKDAFIDTGVDDSERFVFVYQKVINNSVEISFKDNAGGIPKDIITKIFEPYFTTKHESQGTGLGLHMSYNLIVGHMNGTIEVSNEEYTFNNKNYKGAKFVITLPIE